jgi:hypothetical protein
VIRLGIFVVYPQSFLPLSAGVEAYRGLEPSTRQDPCKYWVFEQESRQETRQEGVSNPSEMAGRARQGQDVQDLQDADVPLRHPLCELPFKFRTSTALYRRNFNRRAQRQRRPCGKAEILFILPILSDAAR